MKTEDFERLKAICEKEGFELMTESPEENDKFFVVKKKRVKVGQWESAVIIEHGRKLIQLTYCIDGHSGKYSNEVLDFLHPYLEKYLNGEIE